MHDLLSVDWNFGSRLERRHVVALAIVGVVLVSAVGSSGLAAAYAPAGPSNPTPSGNGDGGGMMGGGSSGTTTTSTTTTTGDASGGSSQSTASGANASSSAGSGNNRSTPKQPVNATIRQFKQQNLGYQKLSSSDKQQLRAILTEISQTDSKKGRIALMNEMGKKINWPKTQGSLKRREIVRANFGIGTNPKSTPKQPVNATIQQFKQQNLGYSQLSASQKQNLRKKLQELKQTAVRNPDQVSMKQQRVLSDVGKIFKGIPNESKREKIIKQNFGFGEDLKGRGSSATNPDFPDIDIPGLLDAKIKAFADAMREGAGSILNKVYGLAFSTSVPQNDGWKEILGEPTNKPFKPLYEQLVKDKLYPVLNYLLATAVLLIGISLVVTPLMSRFRGLDLILKFTSFLFLYVSAWAIVTLMHGVVNDITVWLRPSQQAMEALATNVTKLSAGAVGAYFVGAGGILASVFSLGVELGLRRVALQYFFPYIFPVLLLLLYVSPWQRLKSFASVVIWQYVNVLTMVIPMAILLKAAAIVSFTTSDGVVSMLVLVALFLFAVSIPGITTYTFLQVPGKAASAGYSAAAGAASRASTAKDKLGWGDDSASTGTATADTSPGSRTEQAVEVSTDGGTSGVPSSGELSGESIENMDPDGGSTTTTAGQVRDLEQSKNQDPMNPSAMKESYFEDHPQRMTMDEKLANQ